MCECVCSRAHAHTCLRDQGLIACWDKLDFSFVRRLERKATVWSSSISFLYFFHRWDLSNSTNSTQSLSLINPFFSLSPCAVYFRSCLPVSGELPQAAPEGQHTMAENNTQKKKSRWTSLEIGLLTIVSLLFVVVLALIILFATHNSSNGEYSFSTDSDLLQKKLHGVP